MKSVIPPCTPEEMNALIDAASDNEFYYMLFNVAKTTGRRLGELVGTPEMTAIGKKQHGVKRNGEPKYYAIKKRTGNYIHGVQVKDIKLKDKSMDTYILKGRRRITKEALLTDDVCRLIKQYISKRNLKDEDYIFREVSYRAIQEAVKKYAAKAGIKHPVTFHSFRHFLITELLKQGFSYDQVSKVTGHSNLGTIGIYDHSVANDMRPKIIDAINKIE